MSTSFQVNVYPNPASDYLVIKSAENEMLDLRLSNMMGKAMQVKARQTIQGALIDVSKLPKGNYYLEIMSGSGKEVRQVMIGR